MRGKRKSENTGVPDTLGDDTLYTTVLSIMYSKWFTVLTSSHSIGW